MASEEEKIEAPATQVTTKDPKKVAAGKRLAKYNLMKREELKRKREKEKEEKKINISYTVRTNSTLTYGIGATLGVIAVVVGYQVWKSKERKANVLQYPATLEFPQDNKFDLK